MKIRKHGYQRNGVGGIGFYWFDIDDKDDDGYPVHLIATLTVDCDELDEYPKKFNGSCRVVSPDCLGISWRGDVFESSIRKLSDHWYLKDDTDWDKVVSHA